MNFDELIEEESDEESSVERAKEEEAEEEEAAAKQEADVKETLKWCNTRLGQTSQLLQDLQFCGMRGYLYPDEVSSARDKLFHILTHLVKNTLFFLTLFDAKKLASPVFWAIVLCQDVIASRPGGWVVDSLEAVRKMEMDFIYNFLASSKSKAFVTAEAAAEASTSASVCSSLARRISKGKTRHVAVHSLGDKTKRLEKIIVLSNLASYTGLPLDARVSKLGRPLLRITPAKPLSSSAPTVRLVPLGRSSSSVSDADKPIVVIKPSWVARKRKSEDAAVANEEKLAIAEIRKEKKEARDIERALEEEFSRQEKVEKKIEVMKKKEEEEALAKAAHNKAKKDWDETKKKIEEKKKEDKERLKRRVVMVDGKMVIKEGEKFVPPIRLHLTEKPVSAKTAAKKKKKKAVS